MSESWISAKLRRLVQERASNLCEYCLISFDDFGTGFHIDHVIGEKHAGPTLDHNLCFACMECNLAKGSDLATLVQGELVRLFNPRIDSWIEHFALDGPVIRSRTKIGEGTLRLLGMNEPARIGLRKMLIKAGRYPSERALKIVDQS